jgi:hypothetical protein
VDKQHKADNNNDAYAPLPQHLDGLRYRSTRPCRGQHPDQAEFQIVPLEFRVPKMDEEKPEPPHRPLSHASTSRLPQQRRRRELSLSDSEQVHVWYCQDGLYANCMIISTDHENMTSCTSEMMETKANGRVQACRDRQTTRLRVDSGRFLATSTSRARQQRPKLAT